MQADGLQQLLERFTHISIIIDNEYRWHILRAHDDAPQSEGNQNQNVASFILSSPIMRRLTTPDRLYRMMQWGARADGNNFRFYVPKRSRSLSGGNP
jgi:hypothetical protein